MTDPYRLRSKVPYGQGYFSVPSNLGSCFANIGSLFFKRSCVKAGVMS